MKRMCAVIGTILLVLAVQSAAADCNQGCEATPLQILSSQVQAKTLMLKIQNPTAEPQLAYVAGTVQGGGQQIHFYAVHTFPASSVALYRITFEHPINVVSCLAICSNPPDASNEGPDPIVLRIDSGGGKPGG